MNVEDMGGISIYLDDTTEADKYSYLYKRVSMNGTGSSGETEFVAGQTNTSSISLGISASTLGTDGIDLSMMDAEIIIRRGELTGGGYYVYKIDGTSSIAFGAISASYTTSNSGCAMT